jgi:hypothetical protein
MLPAPISKLDWTETAAARAPLQACTHSATHTSNPNRERRELDLLWLTAKTLVHIDATLTDLQTLAQQQADLLRAILALERNAQ